MSSKKYFFIISNGRTGSTWLETMLGELPDVFVDYEFKWCRPTSSVVHKIITNNSFSCSQTLDSLSNTSPIVGSKLILDPKIYTNKDFENIESTIEKEIRIIYLKRDYKNMLFSFLRGTYNILNKTENIPDTNIYKALLKSTKEHYDNKYSLHKINNKASIKKCIQYLDAFINNDKWIMSLKYKRDYFLEINYCEISDRFSEISQFIGSKASNEIIETITQNPPTKKLPPIDINKYVDNLDKINYYCDLYENKRILFNNELIKKIKDKQ